MWEKNWLVQGILFINEHLTKNKRIPVVRTRSFAKEKTTNLYGPPTPKVQQQKMETQRGLDSCRSLNNLAYIKLFIHV